MKDCPNCGATIADEARFCHYCMTSLDEKKPVGAPRRRLWLRTGALALAGAVVLSAIGWGVVAMTSGGAPGTGKASSGAASLLTAQASSRASSEHGTVPSSKAATSSAATAEQPASSEAATVSEQSTASSKAASSKPTSSTTSSRPNSSGASSTAPSSASTSSISDLGSGIGYTVDSESGATGDCTWTLYKDSVLVISGKGAMADYNLWNNLTPWDSKNLTAITLEPGLTTVGSWAFRYSKITSLVIPDSVTSIGTQAFIQCGKLTSVTFGKGLKEIGPSAFINCVKLAEIALPDGCTTIGRSAFRGCESLTNVTIPAGVTSIGDFAFLNCYALKRIVIPASVTSIGENILSTQTDSLSEILPMTDVTVVTTRGSAADLYAQENGHKVEYLN